MNATYGPLILNGGPEKCPETSRLVFCCTTDGSSFSMTFSPKELSITANITILLSHVNTLLPLLHILLSNLHTHFIYSAAQMLFSTSLYSLLSQMFNFNRYKNINLSILNKIIMHNSLIQILEVAKKFVQ